MPPAGGGAMLIGTVPFASLDAAVTVTVPGEAPAVKVTEAVEAVPVGLVVVALAADKDPKRVLLREKLTTVPLATGCQRHCRQFLPEQHSFRVFIRSQRHHHQPYRYRLYRLSDLHRWRLAWNRNRDRRIERGERHCPYQHCAASSRRHSVHFGNSDGYWHCRGRATDYFYYRFPSYRLRRRAGRRGNGEFHHERSQRWQAALRRRGIYWPQ